VHEPCPRNVIADNLELLRTALSQSADPEQVLKILLSHASRWEGIVTRPGGELGRTIFLPIYNVRAVNSVSRIANQPFFARLKEIYQLGTTRLSKNVDAGHTRWAHSIGVVSMLGEALDSIRSHGTEIPEEWEAVTLVAGLAHDAMQGPWSHSLEFVADIFPREHDGRTARWDKVLVRGELVNSNSWLYRLLCWAFGQAKVTSDPEDLVKKTGIILDREACASEYPDWVFLAQLIDSDVDVDRLDYLIRDNRYLGRSKEDEYVAAARTVISSLAVANHAVGNKRYRVLAFEESVREPLRVLLNLRQELYQDVYEHPENVAVDEMIGHALFYILRSRGFFEISKEAGRVETRVRTGLLADVARAIGLLTDHQFSDVLQWLALNPRNAESTWAVQLDHDAGINPFEPLEVRWIDATQKDTIDERVDLVLARVEESLRAERESQRLPRTEMPPLRDVKRIWREVVEKTGLNFEEKLGLFTCLVNTYGKKLAVEMKFWTKLLNTPKTPRQNFQEQLRNFLEASFGPAPSFQVKDFVEVPLIHIAVPWHPLIRKAAPYTTEVGSELPYAFYSKGGDGTTTCSFDPVHYTAAKTWLPFLSCPEWLKRFQGSFIEPMWKEFIEREYGEWVV
jgi:HD superfamily phosphohydrolase